MALLIPAAFLGERLLLGATQITRQLAGFGALLAVVWLAVSQVHPAFAIAHPLVILLAFAIMAMASLVLVLIISRFNSFMKERGDRIHHVEMRRFSVAHAAFMLGHIQYAAAQTAHRPDLDDLGVADIYSAFLCLIRESGTLYLAISRTTRVGTRAS